MVLVATYKWSNFLGVDLQPCKTITDMLAPVEHANWVQYNYQPGILPLTRMMFLQPNVWSGPPAIQDLVSSPGEVFPPPSLLPSPPPTCPLPCNAGLKLMHTLKRPKIKQETTSKVNCIIFNRLLSPVLLNEGQQFQ